MTIDAVKLKLKVVGELVFNHPCDENGYSTDEQLKWVRAWDNETRTDVHMPYEVMQKLVVNRELDALDIQQDEAREGKESGKAYRFVRLVSRGLARF